MRLRRTLEIVLAFIAAIFLYHFIYLGCATAKLLGHGTAFEFWRGPVTRSMIFIGPIETDVYTGNQSHFPLVLVHGVNESGKNSPDLRPVAEMLAGAGFRVYVPELVRMTHQNVTMQDIDDVSLVLRSFATGAGL